MAMGASVAGMNEGSNLRLFLQTPVGAPIMGIGSTPQGSASSMHHTVRGQCPLITGCAAAAGRVAAAICSRGGRDYDANRALAAEVVKTPLLVAATDPHPESSSGEASCTGVPVEKVVREDDAATTLVSTPPDSTGPNTLELQHQLKSRMSQLNRTQLALLYEHVMAFAAEERARVVAEEEENARLATDSECTPGHNWDIHEHDDMTLGITNFHGVWQVSQQQPIPAPLDGDDSFAEGETDGSPDGAQTTRLNADSQAECHGSLRPDPTLAQLGPSGFAGSNRAADVPMLSLPGPPDDIGNSEIMSVHSSCPDMPRSTGLAANSGSDLRLFLQMPMGGSVMGTPPGADANACHSWSYHGHNNEQCILRNKYEISPREVSRDVHTHGAGTPQSEPGGFVGQSPFWTSSANEPCTRRQVGSGSSGDSRVIGEDQQAKVPAGPTEDEIIADKDVAPDKPCTGDLSTPILCVIGQCVDLLIAAIDVPADTAPPEEELTTVLLETKEQRLKWRDFLSEAVSKHRTDLIFTSYDVEAEPPRYPKPPLSMPLQPTSEGAQVGNVQKQWQANSGLPHIVAPRGAGWSPVELQGSTESNSVASGCHLGGCGPKFAKQMPTVPARASGDCEATMPTSASSRSTSNSWSLQQSPHLEMVGEGASCSTLTREVTAEDSPEVVSDDTAFPAPGVTRKLPVLPPMASDPEDKRDPPPAG